MKFVIIKDMTIAQYESDTMKDGSDIYMDSYTQLEVPEGLDADCIKAILVNDVITLVEDTDKVTLKAQSSKNSRLLEVYNTMNSEVLSQMAVVFGTTNPDSAVRQNEIWKLMQASPSSWLNKKADKAIGGLTKGEIMDTAEKVSNFANARIAEATTYALWSYDRIEQCRADQAVINAE